MFVSRAYRRADIIHLQLVHASPFFSLLNVPLMTRNKRVVWTVHDPWLLTGHCVYPLDCDRWRIGCGQCPDLDRPQPMRRDRSAAMWKVKRWIFSHSNVTLVVASRYMRDLVSQSPILSHLPVRIIPFGISMETFKPMDRSAARSRLGIPSDVPVIAVRFRGVHEPFKGGDVLVEALRQIRSERPIYLVTLEGSYGLEEAGDSYRIVDLGWIEDAAHLAEALNAADLFVMPSRAEAFGVMAIEAMACGIPVIVGDGTSLPEVVHAPDGGVAVPAGEPTQLAQAIEFLLRSPDRRSEIGHRAASIARDRYQVESYVQRHLDLYQELIEAPP
jgi:glycosyltransferase involved in cell wall biosynthesis